MGRTVSELTATLQADELAAWMAFNDLSPLSDERLDLLVAKLCLTVCQAQGMKKASGGQFVLGDFLLFKVPQPPVAGNVYEFLRGRVNPKRIVKRDEVN